MQAAATKIVAWLRRHMYRMRWRRAVLLLVLRLRDEQRLQRDEAALEHTICRFREILKEGFTASKVAVHGNLKTIQLRLVVNTTCDECYLTWTPSKKRDPRVMLHEIESVVPARKNMEGTAIPIHLLRKVSYRRTFILSIHTKSMIKGVPAIPKRMILQVATAKERDFFVKGFHRYLDNRTGEGYVDATGVPRMDTRRAALSFFNPPVSPPSSPPQAPTTHPSLSRLEQLELNELRRKKPPAMTMASANTPAPSSVDVLSGDEDEGDGTPMGLESKRVAPCPVDEPPPTPLLSHLYSTRYDAMDMKDAEQAMQARPVLTAHQAHLLDEEDRLSSVFDRILLMQT
ncbi:hypothetical protein DYB36_004540 [Aphanomyces astaci]|uniref:Uncharacterized protein n=1 Tax=Aphanomyces astaci TaxID=112090 RepID=A0A397BK40_APHAT|nr:hypothetical protein DYB36_004540 [Aphanomyces astaci]